MAILLRHRQLTIPSTDYPAAATTTPAGGNPLAASDGAGANRVADGGEDFGLLLNYSIWLMTGVSLAVLVLRVYCKVSRKRTLWWDDWVLKLSWLCLATAAAMTTVSVSHGYGRSRGAVPASALERMPALANVAGFFSIAAALWSKTSFALTLARISDGWVLRLVWAIVASMTCIMGSSAAMLFFKIDTEVKVAYFMFATAYSGAMDITLSIVPWKIIWNLRMSRREKMGVLVAMSMGVFAGATSFIKVTKVPTLNGTEPVDSVQLVILGIAESATTIIAASIPVLRALIREGKTPSSPPPPQPLPQLELGTMDDKVSLGRSGSVATTEYTK